MTTYQKPLESLRKTGMFFSDVKKKFVGKIDQDNFFHTPSLVINTFGYYINKKGTWVVFVTDEERGIETFSKSVDTEEDAIAFLLDFSESSNFSYFYNQIINNFNAQEKTIVAYLQLQYGYSPEKAQRTLNYLLQVKDIAFEYWYFIKYGDFIPDKFAENYSGYTAKRLKQETSLTELGAFNYMVYLKRKPEEALANLKKGLPRRKLFSPQDVENLKKYMD